MNNIEFESARLKAIKYVGISKKTIDEVRSNLLRKKYDNEIIQKVIDYLIELDYLNDEEYVNAYIRQNERALKYSIFELREKLKNKGIKSDIINDKINLLSENKYEDKVVEKITNVKSKTLDYIGIKQYLYRRGFKWNGEV